MARIKRNKGNKFRSKLEPRVATSLRMYGLDFEYETEKIPYTLIKEYVADFIIKTPSGKKVYIEVKGQWDTEDRRKHLALKQQHPDIDIRFVFQNANARIGKGSPTRYKDICEGRGRGDFKGVTWEYTDAKTKPLIPKDWFYD